MKAATAFWANGPNFVGSALYLKLCWKKPAQVNVSHCPLSDSVLRVTIAPIDKRTRIADMARSGHIRNGIQF